MSFDYGLKVEFISRFLKILSSPYIYVGYPRIVLSSTRRGLLMNDCPEGWPLQVIRDGTYPAQVCRSNSSLHWQCAPRWRKLLQDPYCIFDYVANKTLSNKTKPQFGSDATNLKMTRVSHERKLNYTPTSASVISVNRTHQYPNAAQVVSMMITCLFW